jgi:hypothetical protein
MKWSELLQKYLDGTITTDELRGLEKQRLSCPVKQQQFAQWAEPGEFRKQLAAMNKFDVSKSWQKLKSVLFPAGRPD